MEIILKRVGIIPECTGKVETLTCPLPLLTHSLNHPVGINLPFSLYFVCLVSLHDYNKFTESINLAPFVF